MSSSELQGVVSSTPIGALPLEGETVTLVPTKLQGVASSTPSGAVPSEDEAVTRVPTKLVVCTAGEDGCMRACEELEFEEPVLDEETLSKKDGCFAWVVCAASFTIQVLVVGQLHAYGVFYVAFLKEFKSSSAEAAWVGAGCYGITMAVAPVSSMVINRWGHRLSACMGCLICAAGLAASSFASSITVLYGTFMVLFAVGNSFAYTPCMTIAGDYFDKYVTVATGLMTAGTSTGTLVLNPLSQALVDSIGWRNTMRVYCANCAIGFFCALTFIPLVKDKKGPVQAIKTSIARDQMKSLQLWKNKVYIVWIASIFFVMFGYYTPYVHLIAYAEEVGVPASKGSIILMVLGASTAIGRVGFGKIVTMGYLDHLHLDQLSMTVTGVAAMLLPLIRNFYGLLAYVLIVGLVDGCYVVLLPTLTSTFCGDDKRVIGWGILNLLCSITFTLGPPVAGWMKDAAGNYNIAFHVAGVPIIAGAILLFFIPWAQKTATTVDVKMLAGAEDFHDISVITVDMGESSDQTDGEGKTLLATEPMRMMSQLDRGALGLLPGDGTEVVTVQTGGSTMLFDLAHHSVRVFSSVDGSSRDPVEQVHGSLERAIKMMHEPEVQTSISNTPTNPAVRHTSTGRQVFYTLPDYHPRVGQRYGGSGMAVASQRSFRFRMHSSSAITGSAMSMPPQNMFHTTESDNKLKPSLEGEESSYDSRRGSRQLPALLPTITEMTLSQKELLTNNDSGEKVHRGNSNSPHAPTREPSTEAAVFRKANSRASNENIAMDVNQDIQPESEIALADAAFHMSDIEETDV